MEAEFEQNELNSAVYLISMAMQISNFAVNYKVRTWTYRMRGGERGGGGGLGGLKLLQETKVLYIASQLLFLMDRTSPLAIAITTALPGIVLLQSLHDAVVQFGGV